MRIPASTYRLQFNRDFGLGNARELLDYFHRLGISDLYASPVFKARPGSTHGYDVTDPASLNPEIGSPQDFDLLSSDLQARGMGLLIDIVPNHMAVSLDNPWWYDILENGRRSAYADYFDIDWSPASGIVENKVILPILRTAYGEALEGKKFRLFLDEKGFGVDYYGLRLPLEQGTTRQLLAHRLEALSGEGSAKEEILALVRALDSWTAEESGKRGGHSSAMETEEPSERSQRKQALQARIWQAYRSNPQIQEFIDQNIRTFNGRKGDPSSFDHMDRLLNDQWYRLTFWRTALENINYRRFFNISDLVSVRAEDRRVFRSTHRFVFKLLKEGKATGLRVDHIDGLRDPLTYLAWLQEAVQTDQQDRGPTDRWKVFVAVEKILIGDERLPEDWVTCGTTGYDFLNYLNGLFVDPEGFEKLKSFYSEFTGVSPSFRDVEYEKKKVVIGRKFFSEFRSLQDQLNRLATRDRYGRDVSRRELERALLEASACLPVYRTYVRSLEISGSDRQVLEQTFAEVAHRNPGLSMAAQSFVRRVLTLEFGPGIPDQEKDRWLTFIGRWQQFTGPIAAKGIEDTALYVYNCLLSLNEVGGDPSVGPVSVPEFNRHNEFMLEKWPSTMNATSTHDTKRGEDARARLNVLSELSETWIRRMGQWSRWNDGLKQTVSGERLPDPNEESLIYQTLIGAWPLDENEKPGFPDRLKEFVEKAMREARTHSNWRRPNEANEGVVKQFVLDILREGPDNLFLPDFGNFQKEVAFFGAINGLSQVVLKVVSPGVPDFYQGSELWNLSMVDPDNRRPVDFELRSRFLAEIEKAEDPVRLACDLLTRWKDGAVKLLVTSRLLNYRRANQELFQRGQYQGIDASGRRRDYLCGLVRHYADSWVVAVVPRFVANLVPEGQFPVGEQVWEETMILLPDDAPNAWRNVLTREVLSARQGGPNVILDAASVFSALPVALLEAV